MQFLPSQAQDMGVLRRIIFATVHLPKSYSNYWPAITRFANLGNHDIGIDTVKIAVENLQMINKTAFTRDSTLCKELQSMYMCESDSHPLGVILVSEKTVCDSCQGNLLIRKDRLSHLTIYTTTLGTITGSHYHKYCQNYRKGCCYRQYYGYSTDQSTSAVYYDPDWYQHEYFISSNETAFDIQLIRAFDAELFIGNVSYSQKAEIYNYTNGYPVPPKTCSTLGVDEKPKM
jgi:hypothetical protein